MVVDFLLAPVLVGFTFTSVTKCRHGTENILRHSSREEINAKLFPTELIYYLFLNELYQLFIVSDVMYQMFSLIIIYHRL